MEPCLFRHGKDNGWPGKDNSGMASMEPCLFRHGKREATSIQWTHVCSDMVRNSYRALQWSHVFSDMVRVSTCRSNEGNISRLQWSHVFSDMVREALLNDF
jgi:hypothetical protein